MSDKLYCQGEIILLRENLHVEGGELLGLWADALHGSTRLMFEYVNIIYISTKSRINIKI